MTPTTLRFKRLFCVTCLLALISNCPSFGQELTTATPEEVGVSSAKVEELSSFMQSLVDEGKIAGGVTMMARHGKVIQLKAVGMADREEKKPMTTDAIFRIASMSKPITSVAAMMLYDQGKLGLDDPVSKFIPEFKNPHVLVSVDPLVTEPARCDITIRHLLTHTSGLGYTPTEKIGPIYKQHGITTGLCTSDVPLEQMIAELAGLPLLFHPGEKFQYGMSTDVLGRVVEVASGVTLDRFIEERVCRPLGMNDTFFKVPADKLPRLVTAYVPKQPTGIQRLEPGKLLDYSGTPLSSDYPTADTHKYFSGGGGLCSTAADYFRFCQMLLNGGEVNGTRLLRAETVEMMTVNQTGKLADGFGLGFGVMPDTDDVHEQLRDSYFWGGFWSTSFRISPRGDWILITMSQVAWEDDGMPVWGARYENFAAESIE
ncbi:MAG: serine hydrolase domain-containing protein [Pirellulaceae bacterium]